MSNDIKTLSVNIMDKEYQISCPADEEDALKRSARYLNEQMLEIRSTGKVVGVDRVAVMAALNITNDLLMGSKSASSNQDVANRRIKMLNEKIANILPSSEQQQT
jgi:cell division protein ZapA